MTQRRLKAEAYTVGWICALPIELAAAQTMLDEKHLPPHGIDSNQYTLGRIGSHNVVLACLPAGQMGIGAAAFSAGQATSTFKSIRFGLMVGVGGGAPSGEADVRLGDVVVSHPLKQHSGVVQYDFGKTGEGGRTMRTGSLNAPPKLLLNAVAHFKANCYQGSNPLAMHLSAFDSFSYFGREKAGPDILFKATYNHSGGETCELCSKDSVIERFARKADREVTIHYGTIASGNQVIKDGASRDRLSKELGGVLCFEMEAAGLMNDFPCLVVRGICDYADSHKNKAWQPYAAATAAACAKEILSLVPEATASATETEGELSKFHIPFSLRNMPVGRFADRPQDMEVLEGALLSQGQASGRKTLVLHGLGGIGKTQLAVAFARRYKYSFSSILWLDGSSRSSLKQSIATLANRIPTGQIPETSRMYATSEGGDVDTVVKDMLGWLSKAGNSNWLVVIDSVDQDHRRHNEDPEAYDVDAYLPEADHGSVLITTRLPHLGQLGERWEIEKVNNERARAIFEMWYGSEIGRESAELLSLLDGLPLALAQAAAYMSENATSIQTYTRLYKKQWRALMELEDGKHMPLRNYANGSVATTWMISFTAIRAKSEAAANLLLLWAHLDNKNLHWELLATASQKSAAVAVRTSLWLKNLAERETEFIKAIRILRNYSLVESTTDQNGHATHPVVHQWAFNIQEESQRVELSWLAIVLVGLAVPARDERRYWETQLRLLPHAERCKRKFEDEGLGLKWEEHDDVLLWAFHSLGDLYTNQGKLVEAEQMYQQALQGYEKALGPDHRSTLNTVHNLGILYRDKGKLVEAEQMYQRALQGKEKTLGPDHTSTLDTVNNLGILYSDRGKLVEAEQMYQRALQGYEKALRPDHTSTLNTVNNLGILYRDQGKFVKAEQMYQRALQGKEKALGPDHTSTLDTVNNLGSLYKDQGKLAEAERMYQRALQGYEKAWGPEHTSTLNATNNLGILYADRGKLVEAEQMYQRALQGKEKALGPDHTSTLDTVNNLGILYAEQRKLVEAEQMCQRALQGYEKALGPDHTSTLNIIHNLGIHYKDQGKFVKAEQMYQRALQGKEKAWGPDHTLTLDTVNNLGSLYKDQGKLVEAEQMYKRALEGYEKAIGLNHISTFIPALNTMWGFASLRERQSREDDARTLYSKSLSGFEKVLGTSHRKCQTLRDKLAALDSERNSVRSRRLRALI